MKWGDKEIDRDRGDEGRGRGTWRGERKLGTRLMEQEGTEESKKEGRERKEGTRRRKQEQIIRG